MALRIVFPKQNEVELEVFEPEPIRPGALRLKTEVSLLSTGTEGICLQHLFEPGTHWDDWVKHPFYPGYSTVGRITEIGEGVTGWQIGQRAVAWASHATEAVVDAGGVSPAPESVEPEEACWFALALVGFMGAKNGRFRLGDSIALVGAGPVGQMAVRWAVACGARHVVSIDPVAWRLEMSKKAGATATVCGTVADSIPAVIEACGGVRPRVVVDVTGHPRVFEQCLALPRDRGVLVVLGDTGAPSQQRLTRDLIRRGLHIVGAHGSHEEGEWSRRAIDELFFDLVQRHRFDVSGLVTHVFRPEQCKEAYTLVTSGREASMGILFDWR
ncbi:MAG: zinc-binding alcohol dehydrogenase [Fimbriimonas sp.]|nr:zinc-binding alcohol dehydrogenase [Fimbriimonas sp.]